MLVRSPKLVVHVIQTEATIILPTHLSKASKAPPKKGTVVKKGSKRQKIGHFSEPSVAGPSGEAVEPSSETALENDDRKSKGESFLNNMDGHLIPQF
jgi:hypothetical protein